MPVGFIVLAMVAARATIVRAMRTTL